jgi:phosphoglycerate dehydrogenase-like enzyme
MLLFQQSCLVLSGGRGGRSSTAFLGLVPLFASSCLRMMASSASSGGGSSAGPPPPTMQWNKHQQQQSSAELLSPPYHAAAADEKIKKEAIVLSISKPNDPANVALDQGMLPDHCRLVGVVDGDDALLDGVVADDPDLLQSINAVFVSHPHNSRELLGEVMRRCPNVEWVHTRSAGIDFCYSLILAKYAAPDSGDSSSGKLDDDDAAAAAAGRHQSRLFVMTNAKGQFSSTLAEYAMGAITYYAKDFQRLKQAQHRKHWDKYVGIVYAFFDSLGNATYFCFLILGLAHNLFLLLCFFFTYSSFLRIVLSLTLFVRTKTKKRRAHRYSVLELRRSTLGIVGYGDIGRATAKLAKAYGMRVIGLRRRHQALASSATTAVTQNSQDEYADEIVGPDALNDLFGRCDYVLCALPLTPTTRGFIGAEQFAAARPGTTVFINVGRGPVVDECALIAALQSGQLRGAALDVFETEPLPVTSELWELDNVLLSVSGRTVHMYISVAACSFSLSFIVRYLLYVSSYYSMSCYSNLSIHSTLLLSHLGDSHTTWTRPIHS